jgi:hypothetical protein
MIKDGTSLEIAAPETPWRALRRLFRTAAQGGLPTGVAERAMAGKACSREILLTHLGGLTAPEGNEIVCSQIRSQALTFTF